MSPTNPPPPPADPRSTGAGVERETPAARLAALTAVVAGGPPPGPGQVVAPGARDLRALGAESETGRSLKRVLPWVLSFCVHLALIVVGFIVTWTVVLLDREEEPALVVADFDDVVYEPLSRMTRMDIPVAETLVQDRLPVEVPEERVEPREEAVVEPMPALPAVAAAPAPARAGPETTQPRVSFVGISTTNARRIAYVIDASGSMIRALPIVIDELARSLRGLVPEQEFSVVFFSRNQAIVVPPRGRMIAATAAEKQRVLGWIDDNVIPAGRSNPVAAIEAALRLHPDVIFMLSENITGSGEFEIDQVDLLALLDALNPRDPETGRRPTQINCVQFLDPDPLQTLRHIAEEHGGPNGYKFLDRAELGLKAP